MTSLPNSISKDPDIVRVREIRDQVSTDVKELYGLTETAEGTGLGNLKRKAHDGLRCAKAKLKKMTSYAKRLYNRDWQAKQAKLYFPSSSRPSISGQEVKVATQVSIERKEQWVIYILKVV